MDIGDWSLLFATQNQPFTTTQAPTRCFTFAPGTEIRPGGYFLVICSQGVSQMGAYWLPGGDVFAVNYTEDGDKWLTLSAAGGKLALVMNSDECTGADDPNLVDMVCWGSPSDYLGNGPAVGTPKVLDTLARVKDMDDDGALSMAELFGGSYTGDNIRDFETAWPNPRDSFSAATETEYVAPVTAPQSRTLLAGTPVILECETENAIIFYSLDGAPYEEYTGPIDSTGLLQTRIMAFAIAVVGGNTIYGDPSLFGFVFLAPDGNYTISQARTLLDQEVEVTGVVTFMETNAAGTSVTFTMQDETGGITVRGSAYEFRNVSPGKTVKVKGMRASYRGLEQIVNAQLRNTPVLTGMPAPIVATAADLNDYEFAETHESMYVVLEIARMDEIKYEGGFGGTPPATGIIDGTGVINIHYIPTITEIQKGDIVEVRAVLTQNAQDLIAFLDGYFLRIMDESWITLIERPLVSEEEWTIAAWDQGTGSGTPQMLASGGEYGWMSVVRNADTDDEVYNITTSKSSMVAKNWNQPGRYLQFSISTKGFKEIMLSAKLRVSAAGPRNFKMEYSLDGVTFLPVPDSNFSVAHNKVNDTLMQRLYRFALPVELENQDTVILRWMLADNMRGDGSNGKISGAGALNFTGVHFTGIPVEDLPIVIATPPAGEVPLGQSVGLTSDPVGADIYYRRYIAPVYGEEEEEGPLVDENPEPWTLYTGTPVTLPDLPYTLQAYAEIVGSPTLTGRIFNFEYVQARCAPVKSTAYTGSLREDQQVTLSTATSGATLMVTITTRHGLSGQLTMNYSGVDIYNMSFGAGLFPVHVEVYANKSGYLDSEILVLDYTLRESGGEQFYFGQIHSHTTLSDGAGSIEDAYNYAYHAQNVDFLFITDHSHYLDTPGNLGTMDGKKLGTVIPSPLGGTTTKWEYAKSVADNYTDGTFVADFGYEMTWSGQYGHINTYATEGFVSRNNGLYTTSGGAGLRTYYDTLAQYPQSISMFNHPGSTFGTFDDYAYYTEEYDAQMHLIEVGNGEGRIPSGGYWRSYEQYTRALDKGWHLAPANNQDNHKGRWGDANTGRTVVWTNEFSRNGVLQAMRELCVYATEDHNLEITYFINGEPMGTIFEFKPEYLNFKVTVYDPDIKDKDFTMSVITSNGAVAYSAPGVISGSSAKEFTFTLQPDQAYYYIRIDQADGDIAVTAPIWVGEVMKVSVDLKADTNTPVVGKSMQLTATISNSEQLPFVVSRVEYFADNSSFGVNTPTLSVPAAGTRTDSISYTPTAAGRLSLRVEVTGTVDGAPVTVSGLLELNVLLPTDVLHIALDASHSNMYVNGNQADRYDQLELIAKEFNADVRLIEGGITDVKLADVGLLILTAPYFSWNNVGSAYTSAELAAIVNYANKGGNIAVMGKADRGDGATKANARLNAVLSELGAKASLHAATAIDTQYAQNMTSYDFILPDVSHYDLSSRFLADVQAESSWALEYYAGSTVQPNGAQVLVHGGEYTVSTAFDNLSTTAPYLPIGGTPVVSGTGAALVTAETLSGGGYLLVSGFAFFNDWQIPAIDVIGETRNVNYFMTRNMIMAAVKTTPIGEVRPAAEGRWFAIEGIVTSNGSDFDVNTAFFDSIYVQDETGGINLFPVSGDFELGEKVWACGFLGEYQGDRQLSDVQIYHYGEGLEPKEPIYKTTQQSMYEGNQGWLVKVEGVVTEVLYNEGVVEYIFIDDGSGITRVFIDGYIYCDEPGCDKSGPGHDFGWVVVGAKIRAVGIASTGMHPDGEGVDQLLPRIRVRNRREVEPIDSFTPQLPDGNPFVWGDADLSGVCTAADAAAVLRYLAGLSDLSGQGYINGNVIADDDLNAADAALILRYLAGLYVIPTTT
ncbi:MAG: hypothetical protein FWF10_07040 [Clostridiales bacterium]|nr:hypothetical protein [Clostridiales bacterium]